MANKMLIAVIAAAMLFMRSCEFTSNLIPDGINPDTSCSTPCETEEPTEKPNISGETPED